MSQVQPCPPNLKSRFDVSRESWEKLEQFVGLLVEWQSRINLIAPSTTANIWERHVADSLQLRSHIPAGSLVVDLGSGAGFPGVVLAHILLDADVHLIEANSKKVAFLRTALRLAGSRGIVHQIRLEDLTTALPALAPDIVTARALAPLPKLLELAYPLMAGGARGLFHKGENLSAEMTEAAKTWTFDAIKHPSLIDSKSSILEVRDIRRVGK